MVKRKGNTPDEIEGPFLKLQYFQWCLPVRLLVASNRLLSWQKLLNFCRKLFCCFWCWHMICISDGGLWPLSCTLFRWQTCFFTEIIPWLDTWQYLQYLTSEITAENWHFVTRIFFLKVLYIISCMKIRWYSTMLHFTSLV